MKHFLVIFTACVLLVGAAEIATPTPKPRPAPNPRLLTLAGVDQKDYQILTETSGVRVVIDKKGAMAVLPD